MDSLRKFFDEIGQDSSSLDETIGDYVLELTRAGNDDAEIWNFLEGCYPELEESPEEHRSRFSDMIAGLREASRASLREDTETSRHGLGDGFPGEETVDPSALAGDRAYPGGTPSQGRSGGPAGGAADEDGITFLRDMMPQVSDRGLGYVLHRLSKGDRAAAAGYLLDHSSAHDVRRIEEEAEACERRDTELRRKAEEEKRRAHEQQETTSAELGLLKKKIVGRYADEVEGAGPVARVVPDLQVNPQRTRYRDGKIVTTTGAKVIVENLKPEWDGGSRGRVKTKGKRGKGFV